MAHRHRDGGASGAVYGSMAAAAIGGMIAIPVIVACGLFLRLCLQHWKVTLPPTLAYFMWSHPHDTWLAFVHLPEIVLDTWRFDVVPFLDLTGALTAEIYDTWPGFVILNLLGLYALGAFFEGVRSAHRAWYDHI